MPVILHDAEREKTHLELCDGFTQDSDKCCVILRFEEDWLLPIPSIHDVVDVVGSGVSSRTRHGSLVLG